MKRGPFCNHKRPQVSRAATTSTSIPPLTAWTALDAHIVYLAVIQPEARTSECASKRPFGRLSSRVCGYREVL